jgi:hypothetical protein
MCGDIFHSLHAFVQRLMAEHYDQHALDVQYKQIKRGCKLKLNFLSSEVHAMSLYDPNVTLNVQVPHGILLTLPQGRPAEAGRTKGNQARHQPPQGTPEHVQMSHCIENDVQVTRDLVWLRRHGAVRTRQGWMILPFTDLRPFVHMIKGTNVVTSDSLFEMSDTIEHDARRIASAHMQCGTDNMPPRSALLPGMPHHVSCSCTVCKSAEKSNKLHNCARTLC